MLTDCKLDILIDKYTVITSPLSLIKFYHGSDTYSIVFFNFVAPNTISLFLFTTFNNIISTSNLGS